MPAQTVIDDLICKFYAAFDNRAGQYVEAETLAGMFLATAIILKREAEIIHSMSVTDFVRPRVELLNEGELQSFYEWETHSETKIAGGIASRYSTYSKSGIFAGEDYSGSGTKLFTLGNHDGRWKISSLLWEDSPTDQAGSTIR